MTTVSVVIPAYNQARFLREAIDSVAAQTLQPLEIIVVDDGSTDDTPAVLDEYGGRIRAMRQANQGVSAARNAGLAAARGNAVAFLDADDAWRPHKLERQVARLDADPELGLVHCGIEAVDVNGASMSAVSIGLEGWVAEDLLRLDRQVIPTPGSTVLIPRAIAVEVGGFDRRLPPSEDWDFSYRVATRYRVACVAEPLVRYRIHPAGAHLRVDRTERGMLLAFEKAFASADPSVAALRGHAYGRLHRMLAGSYFKAGQPMAFLRHTVASLRHDPSNLRYFLSYPLRAFRRVPTAAEIDYWPR